MVWNWLWLGKCSKTSTSRNILFYTRQGCHLCEEAWEIVAAAQQKHGFIVSRIDVDTEPALATAYGDCVPVVAIDGKVRFRGRVNAVLLERIMRSQ